MLHDFFFLAAQGVLRKRRSSLLTFFTLLISFSCGIMALSLTQSISSTNEEYRLNTFGEWYIALPYTKSGDRAWVERQGWARTVAAGTVYGAMHPGDIPGSFGTIDRAYWDLGHLVLLEGRLPDTEHEVSLTRAALEAIEESNGKTFSIGDEVPIPCYLEVSTGENQDGSQESVGVVVGLPYTLCGVIKDYSELWNILYNRNSCELVSTVMTADGAQALLDKGNAALQKAVPGTSAVVPMEQLFIEVARGDRLDAVAQVRTHLKSTRNAATEDVSPCVNNPAFPTTDETSQDNEIYVALIAVIALMAVFCIYMMNLPAEVHSFAVLRAIGITKGQLLLLMLFESLLLAVPAVLLGVPLGAGLTWLALRLLVYSGSVAIRVALPYAMLKTLFALWLLVILLARLVIFLITLHTPLTGRMQMQARKARRAARLRRTLAVLLLALFGTAAVYTAGEALWPRLSRATYAASPDYVIESNASASVALVGQLAEIEGIRAVEGYMALTSNSKDSSMVRISFDGVEERWTNLYMVDASGWDAMIDFGDDLEAFENGDTVYLMLSSVYVTLTESGRQVTGDHYEWPDAPLPKDGVTVHAVSSNGKTCYAEASAAAKVLHTKDLANRRKVSIGALQPYTIVCSEAFVRKLVEQLPADTVWGNTSWVGFTGGEAFGYQSLLITADENAADLSAPYLVQSLVRKEFGNDRPLTDQSEEKQAGVQTATQELILLYACGGCVAVVTLLLLASALALEAEQERRSYTILRVIGMSLRQMWRRVLGKALWRSVFAVAAGWMLYSAFCVRTQLALSEVTFAEAAQSAWSSFIYYGGGTAFIAALSAVMLAVLLVMSLLSKRGLKESTRLK